MTEPTVLWSPQPGPQTALLECPIFEVFYGGARGGGKTESSIGDWLQHSSEYGEAAIGIFVRRKFKQLAEVIARTKQLFPKLGGRYNEQKAEWRMANGARVCTQAIERAWERVRPVFFAPPPAPPAAGTVAVSPYLVPRKN